MLESLGRKMLSRLFSPVRMPLQQLLDLAIYQQANEVARQHPNPLNRCGRKVFSQADEDGLTFEILRRMELWTGVFAEFGVGNGMENNTLALLTMDWKGFWVGGESLAYQLPDGHKNFSYLKRWITLENVVELAAEGLHNISQTGLDLVSLDLDGNDIFLVEKLLTNGHRPKLFIVEYNAKFPPPIRWHIDYDAQHRWQGDDYFGASLTSYNDLFCRHGYVLVCCNSQTGANAFFVDRNYADRFADVPNDLSELYSDPRFYHYQRYGHPPSVRTVEMVFKRHLTGKNAPPPRQDPA
jgi:hypothetical protein